MLDHCNWKRHQILNRKEQLHEQETLALQMVAVGSRVQAKDKLPYEHMRLTKSLGLMISPVVSVHLQLTHLAPVSTAKELLLH